MHRTLHEGWTLRPLAGPVPAQVVSAGPIAASVPGTVHTDLLAAGLIADPYRDDNERLLAWIGLSEWCYETTFDWTPDGGDHTELVFEGLDTVASIELNGRPIAETYNMHRTYRFEVGSQLIAGPNRLSIVFGSAVRFADQASLDLGARPHVNHHPYNAIRKMACNFGWDWGPDLVTAGIWRPVHLDSWTGARLRSVRPVVDVVDSVGSVEVRVDLATAGAEELVVTATIGAVTAQEWLPAGASTAAVSLVIDDVRRWWPRGYGDPHLYGLTVSVGRAGAGAAPLDTWHGRVGFRTVRLDVRPDDGGTGATFVVNDQPIFVKGANWIPDDVFPHRVTRDRYAARLAQAEEAGLNLLRVWGGGFYEADAFYHECDERGIMTWQDFLFACAAYSEEEPLRGEVVAEARDNVARLMVHPSLVAWNGCNENLQGFDEWDWSRQLDGRTWGAGYYFDLLPSIVDELDPGRPYMAGSPWSWSTERRPNDPDHGTVHIWDVWNQVDYLTYRRYRARFVAEFGWQGPPTWSTLRAAVSDVPLTPESPGLLAHQKAAEGYSKLTRGLAPHFAVPDDMDAWHWAMSLNQARAIRTGVEYFRSLSPYCGGSIVWQLNDCWPAVSWSAVDGAGRRKPLLYALRHAHRDRLITVQPDRDQLRVALVNETAELWSGPLRLSRRGFDGTILDSVDIPAAVAGRSNEIVAVPATLATPANPRAEMLVAEMPGGRALWFFAEDRDSDLPDALFEAVVSVVRGGYEVSVTARTLIRDLALLADKLDPDAVVDDMLQTLLPGETSTLRVATTRALEPGQLTDPCVLRSANQLVRRPTVARSAPPRQPAQPPAALVMDPV